MKNALITGASSEIGLSIAKRLEKDYNLILIRHNADIDLKELKNNPMIYNCDFNDELLVKELINKLNLTKIDLLVNVAALDKSSEVGDIDYCDFEKILRINLLTPFYLIKELYKKNKNMMVINMASTDGIDTYNEYNLSYAASKSALIHITKQLKYIYNDLNIYALCPNYINTKSVREMESSFLKEELKRVNQNKLIEVNDVSEKIIEIINTMPKEIIIRMG